MFVGQLSICLVGSTAILQGDCEICVVFDGTLRSIPDIVDWGH